MKRQQILLIVGGIVLLLVIYFGGRTVPPHKEAEQKNTTASQAINGEMIVAAAKQKLSPSQQKYLMGLENSVVRGDVKEQQIKVYHQLAAFWQDSVKMFEPYAYYTAEGAKLENSEKNLTFAARLYYDNLRNIEDVRLKEWETNQAKYLYNKVLEINPANDSAQIELGGCYMFGYTGDNPQQMMQGIQKILAVSQKTPDNMYAQFMLGYGSMMSGQYDKATIRLEKVIKAEPKNLQAILMIAEAYEHLGDKANAVKYYEQGSGLVARPDIKKEIEARIVLLKK